MTEERWSKVRSVSEWAGKTPDAMPPPSVRLRIFRDRGGRCHRSGLLIRPGDKWDLDHIVAIIDGGENVESNLAPILKDKHKIKTAEEQARRAKTDGMSMSAFGIRKGKSSLTHPKLKRRFDGSVVER